MYPKASLKALRPLLMSATLCLTAYSAHAANYHVSVNTSSLIGSSSAPFALDFTLLGGNSLSNLALLSNFTFTLGGAVTSDPPATTSGNVSGNLTTTISLSDSTSSFFNEFYQGFIPGSNLQFDLSLTTNLNGPTPDSFAFAILDKNLANITTNGPGDALMSIDINGAVPTVQTFTSITGVTVSASAVPEPGAGLLLGTGITALWGFVRRRRA